MSKLAEQAGIDFIGIGESHQEYFVTQAHSVVLAAIAQATEKIKIASTSTIVSTLDPVRVYEDFATIETSVLFVTKCAGTVKTGCLLL